MDNPPIENEQNMERVAIRMDVLDEIIADLNENRELQAIFGIPVSKYLVVVADQNDLRIEDGGAFELTPGQTKRFLEILDDVIEANAQG